MKRDHIFFYCSLFLAGLLGVGLFFILYSSLLDPTNVLWIQNNGWDTFQHHIGWEFFRHAPFTFPFGINQSYGYPIGIPLTYTDSLPLCAFIFKIFSAWLPVSFQYQGIWILLCLILQGTFGFLLLQQYTKRTVLSLVGSLFFLVSPIMHFRIPGHAPLAGHWIILACLWLLLKRSEKLLTWQWSIVFILSLLIHPYFLFMCGALMLAHVGMVFFVHKNVTWREISIFFGIQLAIVLLVGYSLGFWYIGHVTAPGFGDYSMNLNAVFNPYGWYSQILPDLPWGKNQYEGFNYLGFGTLILLIFSFIIFFRQRNWREIIRSWWPVFLVSIILTLFAVSNVVMAGSHRLFTVPVPHFITERVFSIIRASGRFFWPVYYLLVLFSFYIFKKSRSRVGWLLLLLVLTFQLFDVRTAFALSRTRLAQMSHAPSYTLTSSFWEIAAKDYAHVAYIPDYVFVIRFTDSNYGPLALYAARKGMTLNTGYFAREIFGNNDHLRAESKAVAEGNLDPNTLYIISKDVELYTKSIDKTVHYQTIIDGYTIIAPNFYKKHPEIKNPSH